MKLFVAVPTNRDVKSGFMASLISLVFHLNKKEMPEIDAMDMKIMQGCSLLPQARQMALNEAVERGFTHILMLDDDMEFSVDAVKSLIGRSLPVVAANYNRKVQPRTPTAMGLDGEYLSSDGKEGIEQAGWVGMGMCLIDLEAIKVVSAPHFEVRYLPSKGNYMGEDLYFCSKLRQENIAIFVDHDATKLVKHIGDYGY